MISVEELNVVRNALSAACKGIDDFEYETRTSESKGFTQDLVSALDEILRVMASSDRPE